VGRCGVVVGVGREMIGPFLKEISLRRMSGLWLGCVLLAGVMVGGVLLAQMKMDMPMPGTQTIHGLGTTSFATSTKSPEAQAAFLRGLLLLHLFEYDQAAASFVAAEKIDPGFAMAYWGEAMTSNEAVWNRVDVAAGKAALGKFAPTAEARAKLIGDARERAYMAAVELLYDGSGGDDAKGKAERDGRYAKAMEGLSAAYPDDRNAQLFYALALLGKSESVRDVPVYLKAAEISKAIFRLEPNNPGAAHYWIHGMDDPDHAAGALEAARALSKIAPDAPHAQHMCSHIFMALGMWDDVVTANVEAMRVSNALDLADGFPPRDCGHYPDWLVYGYFQQGRVREAEESVARCQESDNQGVAWVKAHPGKGLYGSKDSTRVHAGFMNALAEMQSMAIVESEDWKAGMVVDLSTLKPDTAARYEFATGLAAAERGDLVGAHAALKAMRAAVETFKGGKDVDPEDVRALEVGVSELDGLVQVKDGHAEAGVAELRAAVVTYHAMAFAFGPPVTVKPPEEMLGEVLLAQGDAAGARKAFEESLARAPRRVLSLLGLARAETAAGDSAGAHRDYAMLAAIWHGADAGAVGVTEARAVGITGAR